MKKAVLSLAIFLFLSLSEWIQGPAFAQDTLWSRTYGGSEYDAGRSIQQTADGGYIIMAYTYSFGAGDCDIYLIKTDSLGDTLWTRTYGGSNFDDGFFVQQTTDGGYIVVGRTASFGAGMRDVYLIKTDSNGDTLWTRTYGGSENDYGYSVQQTADGGYIVSGWTRSFGAGNYDAYLIKTDSLGETLWTRTYGGGNRDCGRFVQQTTDGGYIVAGYTRPYDADVWYDVCLIKTDSLGDTLWTRTYGGSNYDYGYSIQQTTDGGYIVVGQTGSFGAGGSDVYLIKTDSIGNTMWIRTYGGSSSDDGVSVDQTTDGGYIVTGGTQSFGAGGTDVYLIKTNSNGDTLWSRTYGGSEKDYGYSVEQTTDGGYIVTGGTHSFGAGLDDVMLTKLDLFGNTCIGEFVSSTVGSFPSTANSTATVVSSTVTAVNIPPTTITSPSTEVTIVCVAIRGDANGDGVISVSDVIYLINYLFKGGPAPDPLWTGDTNCDGQITVSDVVYLINYLFKGGPPPAC